ncbi:MAG: pentapeptide repeat-containing protein [Desulfarculus sp.]|nr:pentapeptide repeat-containing protein [Desulfarculus sp.]
MCATGILVHTVLSNSCLSISGLTRKILRLLTAIGFVLAFACPLWATEIIRTNHGESERWEGRLKEGIKFSTSELKEILKLHELWVWNLKDGQQAVLEGANLEGANLEGANLEGANLKRANLSQANLRKGNLSRADLQSANLSETILENANLSDANLQGSILHKTQLLNAKLDKANLQKAIFNGTILHRAEMVNANLQGAHFYNANLQLANMFGTNLKGARLRDTDLKSAKLVSANLQETIMQNVDLREAILTAVNMRKSSISEVNLKEAVLYGANLEGVIFQPKVGFTSSSSGLPTITGLAKLTFISSGDALGELRGWYKTVGLRDQERQVTYAYHHTSMMKALSGSWFEYLLIKTGLEKGLDFSVLEKYWDELGIRKEQDKTKKDVAPPALVIGAAIKYIAFDLTCAWGLDHTRPLLILFVLMVVPFSGCYFYSLVSQSRDGIWRVWHPDRLRNDQGGEIPERLRPKNFWSHLGLSLYFSLLSAAHIGWRDLNVGAWISRIQPREYTLRATGWVRAVSGVQSLISVYLLALFVLSYFGRPFE